MLKLVHCKMPLLTLQGLSKNQRRYLDNFQKPNSFFNRKKKEREWISLELNNS